MKRTDILVLFMNKMAENGIITGDGDFYGANTVPLKDVKNGFWILEGFTGDILKRGTNYHSARLYPTVIYTIYVPWGSGTALLDEKESQIKNCFNMWDDTKYNFSGDNFAGEITSIRTSDDFKNGNWCGRNIILSLSVHIFDNSNL